jgi:hypothetical protein
LNGNTKLGLGSNSIYINKDISSGIALDVSGVTQIRGNLDVAGVFTVNGAPVSGGGTLTGNVQVGSNNGFVTVNKPQFYSDPSLTIYYDFDTESYNISPNDANTIINKGNGGSTYTATLQGTTTGMIDTSEKKWGSASLKQNSSIGNDGMTINSSIPVSNTFSVSLWVKKSGNASIDRLFEFSNVNTGSSENNTISLNVNTSGKLVPIITNGVEPAVTLSNTYIYDYNIGNNIWNNIVWILVSGKSYIYINGYICQIDTVNPIANLTNRTYGFIARTNNTTGYGLENGNIDDFRYYKDKALSYAEIYQLYNNNFYTLDICGGFLANGSSVIYEPSGSVATANSGSLTLMHGDTGGSSSIMFKSNNGQNDYAYIEYDENVNSVQSLLKYDLSSNNPQTLATGSQPYITLASTGILSNSIKFGDFDNSFAWAQNSTALNGVTPVYCLSFNQTNLSSTNTTSKINFLVNTNLPNFSSFTFSAWIRPGTISPATGTAVRWIIANLNNTSNNGVIDIYLESSNSRIFVLFDDGEINFIRTNTQLVVNTWYHLVFTFDNINKNGYIYINGTLDTAVEGTGLSGKSLKPNSNLVIGMKYGWNTGTGTNTVHTGGADYIKGFRGQMVFLNVFNVPLTASEVSYLYNNPSYSSSTDRGLMTIGIENDGGYINNDRISLFASGGTGFVGVNTKTPQYSLDVSGQMRIYEGTGTIASATNGSLTLEHANAGGASSLVFKGPNSTTSDYAYIEYYDNVYSLQSLYKWNLSPSTETSYSAGQTVDTSVGLNTSVILFAQAASFTYVAAPLPPSTFPSPTYCISFNQTNQTGTPGTGSISYLQSGGIGTTTMQKITISFWIRPNITYDTYNVGGTYYAYYIANFSNSNNIGVIDIYIRGSDQRLFVLINGNTINYKLSDVAIPNDSWTHVAFTFSPNNGYIYINGIKNEVTIESGYTTFSALNTYNSLLLGMKYGYNTGNEYRKGFRGYMNFINVFNTNLTDADILYLYNNPSYSSTTDRGLMTIGIENDGGYINNDRIALWPKNGTGFVGINTKTPQATLDVSGSLNIGGNVKIYGDVEAVSYNAISDYRMKENVVPLDDSFTIDGLNPVTYNLKSSCKKDIGFIAHEVQEFYTFLVSGEKDGKDTQSLNYNGFIGILTKEIQVLKKKVADQERKSAEQDQRIQALEKMIFDLINK